VRYQLFLARPADLAWTSHNLARLLVAAQTRATSPVNVYEDCFLECRTKLSQLLNSLLLRVSELLATEEFALNQLLFRIT